MTLMRFDPFREIDRVTQAMLGAQTAARVMPLEALRRGDEFFVYLDIPGVRQDDIELTVDRNVVNIRAERRSPRQEGDDVIVDERPHGIFARQLFLGDNLDVDGLRANYEQGVLVLTVPVAEESQPRRIRLTGQGQELADDGTTTEQGSEQQPPVVPSS